MHYAYIISAYKTHFTFFEEIKKFIHFYNYCNKTALFSNVSIIVVIIKYYSHCQLILNTYFCFYLKYKRYQQM